MALPAAVHRVCCSTQLSVVGSPVYSTACTSASLYPLRMVMASTQNSLMNVWLPEQVQTEPSLVPPSPQFPSQNSPA